MKKIFAIMPVAVSAGLSLVFAVLTICTAFGGLTADDFDNAVVKTLLITLAGLYLADTIAALCLTGRKSTDREVCVVSSADGCVKITQSTVKELIKKNVSDIKGIGYRGCALTMEGTGVRLDLYVSYYGGKKTDEASAYLRTLVTEVCRRELSLYLSAVNIHVTRFRSTYVPDPKEMTRIAVDTHGEKPAEESEESPVSQTESVEEDSENETLKHILRQLGAENRQNEPTIRSDGTADEEKISEL